MRLRDPEAGLVDARLDGLDRRLGGCRAGSLLDFDPQARGRSGASCRLCRHRRARSLSAHREACAHQGPAVDQTPANQPPLDVASFRPRPMLMPGRHLDRIRRDAHRRQVAGGEQLELSTGRRFFQLDRLGRTALVRTLPAAGAQNRRKVILWQPPAQTPQRAAQLLDHLPVRRGPPLALQPAQLVLDQRPQLDHRPSERFRPAIRHHSAP